MSRTAMFYKILGLARKHWWQKSRQKLGETQDFTAGAQIPLLKYKYEFVCGGRWVLLVIKGYRDWKLKGGWIEGEWLLCSFCLGKRLASSIKHWENIERLMIKSIDTVVTMPTVEYTDNTSIFHHSTGWKCFLWVAHRGKASASLGQ